MAGSLVIGGLPKSRLPFLLGLLAVSAMLFLVAMGQLRREGELARLRSDFVASISHELRTPLAQMRLSLETLRLGRFKTEEQRRWSLDNVEREMTRLSRVERAARDARVSVRGGCFCNPGASEAAFQFPVEDTARCLASTRAGGWSLARFGECMRDYAVGAVRASFGAPRNASDMRRLVTVVESSGT